MQKCFDHGYLPACRVALCLFVLPAERKVNKGFSFPPPYATHMDIAFSSIHYPEGVTKMLSPPRSAKSSSCTPIT